MSKAKFKYPKKLRYSFKFQHDTQGKIVKRPKRDVSGKADEPEIKVLDWTQTVKSNDKVLIALVQITVKSKDGSKDVQFKDMTLDVTESGKGALVVHLKDGADSFDLVITDVGQFWVLSKVTYKGDDYAVHNVNGNLDVSYACRDLTVHSKTGSSISFLGLQIQPNFLGSNLKYFGFDNNCIGFFSPAIWGALFVVFLLLGILFTGLGFIMGKLNLF
jgi:hypothetical protein